MYISVNQFAADELFALHEKWLEQGGERPRPFDGLIFNNVDLSHKILKRARFVCCDFVNCKMDSAILNNADMRRCQFHNVVMSRCSCIGTDFRFCIFDNVWFNEVNLTEADFYMARLHDVHFPDTYTCCTHNFHSVCPEEGSFIGFKRCGEAIVKLQIPEDALRSSATTRKCRCSKARVLEITDSSGNPWGSNSVFSEYDPDFEYVVGKIAEVPDFDTDRWNECSRGIHFFLTRQEAIDYC